MGNTNDTYYLTPKTYDTYYLRKAEDELPWNDMGLYSWPAGIGTSGSWTRNPGDFRGAYTVISLAGYGYTEVKIKSISGWWKDHGGAGSGYMSCLGFVTECDSGDLGTGDSTTDGPFDTTTEANAEAAWRGQKIELKLGANKTIGMGHFDTNTGNNSGSLTYRIYAR